MERYEWHASLAGIASTTSDFFPLFSCISIPEKEQTVALWEPLSQHSKPVDYL